MNLQAQGEGNLCNTCFYIGPTFPEQGTHQSFSQQSETLFF